ncbi:hypothetical protein [Govanella unica]|uniref:Uncharacterized protein n=1 Tax=Govanella unica TaxID=2975056 RepID=A0A9X3TVV9_9PROT|nr:hypothetical protein [Govania unica]MDA5192519.1 hypothetical protein [Govania unica]
MARYTGISENSLQRYEKAGLSPEGQYPSAAKLALLCFELKISPAQALAASLPDKDYHFGSQALSIDAHRAPSFDYLRRQFLDTLEDNSRLRSILKILLAPPPIKGSPAYKRVLWLLGTLRSMFQRQEKFEADLTKAGAHVPTVRMYQNPHSMPEEINLDWVYAINPEEYENSEFPNISGSALQFSEEDEASEAAIDEEWKERFPEEWMASLDARAATEKEEGSGEFGSRPEPSKAEK